MLLKIGKMTPRCPKWIPGVQNDSPVINTLACLDSPVTNTPWSLDSPVMNTQGSQLLSVFWTSIRTGLQKTFWWMINQGVEAPQCINHRGISTTWCVWTGRFFCKPIYCRLSPRWWKQRGVSTPRWWIHWGFTTPQCWSHQGFLTPE